MFKLWMLLWVMFWVCRLKIVLVRLWVKWNLVFIGGFELGWFRIFFSEGRLYMGVWVGLLLEDGMVLRGVGKW